MKKFGKKIKNVTFSFVIPVYNGESTIEQTLESVFAQSLNDYEIIVINNGSTDSTKRILERYRREKNVTVRNFSFRNRARARNRGANLAIGKYLAFVDADVVLSDSWLMEVNLYLKDKPIDALCTKIIPTGTCDRVLNRYRKLLSNTKTNNTNMSIYFENKSFPLINTAACVFRRESFFATGGFNVKLDRNEDLEISLKLFWEGNLLGGTDKASSRVFYSGHLGGISYLYRAWQVQFHSLFSSKLKMQIDWSLLKKLIQTDAQLFCFAMAVETAALLGKLNRKLIAFSRTNRKLVDSGKPFLNYCFSIQNEVFVLPKGYNFIFVGDFVYLFYGLKFLQQLGNIQARAVMKLTAGRALNVKDRKILKNSNIFLKSILAAPNLIT